MKDVVKIGNAQGFWGDRVGAAARLFSQQPDLDFITFDYLAEVTMSVLALQQERDSTMGYAHDFLKEVASLVPLWKKGARVKLAANAGGLNPQECAKAVAALLHDAGLKRMKVGVVYGDDVLEILRKEPASFDNLDTGESIENIRNSLVSANAYLGAASLADAFRKGADIVVTGRVADPSLTVGCCSAHFGWEPDAYPKISGATIAGHLIECGTQATGGIATDWLSIPDPANIGYPIVEVHDDGSFVLTKPPYTGGVVNRETVKEQLLYEIGDPDNYLSPDATVSFLGLHLSEEGFDRVNVSGAIGRAPPRNYKVGATYHAGYRAEGTLAVFGRHAVEKAKLSGAIIFERVKNEGFELQNTQVECLGADSVVPGVFQGLPDREVRECVLRVAALDTRKEAIAAFVRELAPLVTSGPQGTTGYFGGRPKVREAFGFWPCLIDRNKVHPKVEIVEV